jgi:hypothetical protein
MQQHVTNKNWRVIVTPLVKYTLVTRMEKSSVSNLQKLLKKNLYGILKSIECIQNFQHLAGSKKCEKVLIACLMLLDIHKKCCFVCRFLTSLLSSLQKYYKDEEEYWALFECDGQKTSAVHGQKLGLCVTFSITNFTWIELGSKSRTHSDRSAIDCLSYSTKFEAGNLCKYYLQFLFAPQCALTPVSSNRVNTSNNFEVPSNSNTPVKVTRNGNW